MSAPDRIGNWMQTFTGRQFWPCDPRPEDVCIEDIAHALSLQCRFAGHCRTFYSVAEHCVRVSVAAATLAAEIAPLHERPATWVPFVALLALLHDGSEAYIVDVPRPLKPALHDYKPIETRVQAAIEAHFHVDAASAASRAVVHDADEALLATEARDLMAPPPAAWTLYAAPLPERIEPWSAAEAERAFLARFAVLAGVSP